MIVRSVRGDLHGERHDPGQLRRRMLAPLGVSAGFIDAVGGGGWGPVATPTLLAAGRVEPRLVIGSVSAAELLVTVAASVGFLLGLGGEGIELPLVLALLAGGVVAAPLAAWLVRHADPSVLGVVVGTLLLVTNVRTLLLEVGVAGPVRLPILVAIAAAGIALALRVRRTHGGYGPGGTGDGDDRAGRTSGRASGSGTRRRPRRLRIPDPVAARRRPRRTRRSGEVGSRSARQ